MDEQSVKFVKFAKYCKDCFYGRLPENNNPCIECLDTGAREGTDQPVYYKKWDKVSKRPREKKVTKPIHSKMGKIDVIDE